ncbi:MAG TPA: hypothetical protein PK400_13285 [Phycisphaerales bacterium]|nr:hypothetical protein [Phycisphaerales bacterium]HRQ76412.1 hypothetical protein [Phycisphaerales bacterium]
MAETLPNSTSGSTSKEPAPVREFSLFAAVLAWLWPGLGHISLGERKRGVFIMIGVLFLFFTGLLVGGVSSVDRREERLWFLAQGLCGPIAFGADYVHQSYVKGLPPERKVVALAHVSEMGILFIALAGLMNLVVILDAMHFAHHPAPTVPERRRASDQPGGES